MSVEHLSSIQLELVNKLYLFKWSTTTVDTFFEFFDYCLDCNYWSLRNSFLKQCCNCCILSELRYVVLVLFFIVLSSHVVTLFLGAYAIISMEEYRDFEQDILSKFRTVAAGSHAFQDCSPSPSGRWITSVPLWTEASHIDQSPTYCTEYSTVRQI